MTLFIRLLIILNLALLSGCASIERSKTVNKLVNVSPNITYAPAIDVPYSEALGGRDAALKVRWGGEVIKSSKVDELLTRLTVAALPLNKDGRPITATAETGSIQKTSYFVVELENGFAQNVNLNGHLVTFYGDVAGHQSVLINDQSVSVPNLRFLEIVDWNFVDSEALALERRRRANYYYGSSYGRGYGYRSGFGRSFRGGRSFGGGYCRY